MSRGSVGSPVRWATTSAWCTAERMARISITPRTSTPAALQAATERSASARVSASASYVTIARREGLTIRQLAMRAAVAKHHWSIVGSVKQIADQFEEWFTQGAADGFNLMPPVLSHMLDVFIAEVVPILQRRGLFRTRYDGDTLRSHFGLARPDVTFQRP